MLAERAAVLDLTLISAAKAMTTSPSELRGLHASASRDALSGTPLQKLQKLQRLPAVPGNLPNRVNDLLLLRPDPEEQEKSNNRHAVFFHGDIQVRVMEKVSGGHGCHGEINH